MHCGHLQVTKFFPFTGVHVPGHVAGDWHVKLQQRHAWP